MTNLDPRTPSHVMYHDRHHWLAALAEGWELPFVVEPMAAHHGEHSILLERHESGRELSDLPECAARTPAGPSLPVGDPVR